MYDLTFFNLLAFFPTISGTMYNIPICIFLQEAYPFIPPMVYVRPTNVMAIKVSKHVDNAGRVFLPYLSEWNHVSFIATSLYQLLIF